jgi:hypothetical protein
VHGSDAQLCVPHVNIRRDVLPKLTAAGFTCRPTAEKVQACEHGRHREIDFTNFGDIKKDPHVETVQVAADVFAVGTHPHDKSAAAWKLNGRNFPTAVGVTFADYPRIEQALLGWLSKQTGTCDYASTTAHDTVNGYQLSCIRATPTAVSDNNLTVTTWTSVITIATPLH